MNKRQQKKFIDKRIFFDIKLASSKLRGIVHFIKEMGLPDAKKEIRERKRK